MAVFHRAHTSGFCSACSSYRTAWRSQWTLLSLSASVVPPVVKRQAPWANGVHGVADGGATSVTASFDVHLLLQLISADPELRCPSEISSTTGTNHPQTAESNQSCAGFAMFNPYYAICGATFLAFIPVPIRVAVLAGASGGILKCVSPPSSTCLYPTPPRAISATVSISLPVLACAVRHPSRLVLTL